MNHTFCNETVVTNCTTAEVGGPDADLEYETKMLYLTMFLYLGLQLIILTLLNVHSIVLTETVKNVIFRLYNASFVGMFIWIWVFNIPIFNIKLSVAGTSMITLIPLWTYMVYHEKPDTIDKHSLSACKWQLLFVFFAFLWPIVATWLALLTFVNGTRMLYSRMYSSQRTRTEPNNNEECPAEVVDPEIQIVVEVDDKSVHSNDELKEAP